MVQSPGPERSSPVQRACPERGCKTAIEFCLALVARSAEPLQVLEGEGPPESLRSRGPCDKANDCSVFNSYLSILTRPSGSQSSCVYPA